MEFLRSSAERMGVWMRQYRDSSDTSWTRQQFEDYIKSLAKGRDCLAFLDDFPKTIALYRSWHEILNSLRDRAAKENRERWAMIGFKADRNRVYLQTNGSLGSEGSISHAVVQKTIESARQKGIVGLIGSIHSHPGVSNLFSAADLFSMVIPDPELVKAVVEPDDNVFAFRSFESVNVPSGIFSLTQKAFSKYWYHECGYDLIRSDHRGSVIVPSFFKQTQDVNEAIAKRHKLVLYKGVPNHNLRRIYP